MAARIAALAALAVLLLALPAAAQDVESRYQQAGAAFRRARVTAGAPAETWRRVAAEYRALHDQYPQHARGADALYAAALALVNAAQAGRADSDRNAAVAAFRRFTEIYPRHGLADDSLMQIAAIQEDQQDGLPQAAETYRRVIADYPAGDQQAQARRRLHELKPALAPPPASVAGGTPRAMTVTPLATGSAPAPAKAAAAPAPPAAPPKVGEERRLKRIQVMSALQFTRIIATLSGPAPFRHERTAGAEEDRVSLAIQGARPDEALAPVVPGADSLLRSARVATSQGPVTTLTLLAQGVKNYDVKEFNLPTETKLVVDLYPKPKPAPVARVKPRRVRRGAAEPIPPEQLQASLKTSLGLKVRSIMIDPGHGGHDPGATGFGLHEKDAALAIARSLRDQLRRRHPDLRVGLTREGDEYIPLAKRPELAKAFGADLFVSIHLNAHPVNRFQGVETYFLNLSSDPGAVAVAARENATSEKRVSDLNGILLDLLRDTNILESSKLASALQSSLVDRLRQGNKVRDLGVKQAPFMVLIGAEMPSVLVEAGFVTNPEEVRRLKDARYVASIADGVYAGLRKYIEEQNVAQGHGGAAPSALVTQRDSRAPTHP
jgi:N-acetylmuramoyl-L-alanine amidase